MTFVGTGADETIEGTSGDDKIVGGLGSDVINAGDGDDIIEDQGSFLNIIDGGGGNDSIYFSTGLYTDNERTMVTTTIIDGGEGDDLVQILRNGDQSGDLTVDLGAGNDLFLFGPMSQDDPLIFGTTASFPAGGSTTLTTGSGVDRIVLSEGFGTLWFGNFLPAEYPLFQYSKYPNSTLVVTDFTAGAGGDVIDFSQFMVGAYNRPDRIAWDGRENPFATGDLKFVQDGDDLIIRLDADQFASDDILFDRDVVRLLDVSLDDLTAYNLNGYDPGGADISATSGSGTSGADHFEADAGAATFDGLDGNDTLIGGSNRDTLNGGAGDDVIFGGHSRDNIDGGAGSDFIDGGLGGDRIFGRAGDDYIQDPGGSDVIDAGSGNDTIFLDRIRNDSGASGNVVVNAGRGDDFVHYIEARYAGGEIRGIPNETQFAVDLGIGNDILLVEAPLADLNIRTGTGSDTVLLEFNSRGLSGRERGKVEIWDFTPGDGGDVLHVGRIMYWHEESNPFAEGYLVLDQVGDDVLVGWDYDGPQGSDNLTPLAMLYGVDASTLTAFNFAGWDPGFAAPVASTIDGTAAADRIIGSATNNVIDGGLGADFIYGAHGNDTISGGDGNDVLHGGYGDDQIDGGDGDDVIRDLGEGSDTIFGGAGNDDILVWHGHGYENATVTVDAGSGDDVVEVAVPSRTVTFVDLGAGNDRYVLGGTPLGGLTLTLGSGVDVVEVGQIYNSAPDMPVRITDFEAGDGGDILDIAPYLYWQAYHLPFGNFYEPDGSEFFNAFYYGPVKIEQVGNDVHFFVNGTNNYTRPAFIFENTLKEDFTSYNFGTELIHENFTGTADPDVFAGTADNDFAVGNAGDDELNGLAGGDMLDGGRGNDILHGGPGLNLIRGGEGDDTITSGDDGSLIFTGTGNDSVTTGAGADVIDSEGIDNISTGDGDDTIIGVNTGLPTDDPSEPRSIISTGAGNDEVWVEGGYTIDFGDGDDELHAGFFGDFLVTLGDGTDTIYWDGVAGGDNLSRNASFTFTDFEAGDGGDIFVLPIRLLSGRSATPFETGVLELRQDGDDTLLVIPSQNSGDHTVATFQNVDAEALTAHNFLGIEPVFINRTFGIEITETTTIDSSFDQTLVNPETSGSGPNGGFVYVPRNAETVFAFDGVLRVLGETPGPINSITGITSPSGPQDAQLRIGENADIEVIGTDVRVHGLYSPSGIDIVNDGRIVVDYTGTSETGAHGAYYDGPVFGADVSPEDNSRFTNNGELIVTSSTNATGVVLQDHGAFTNTGLLSVHAAEFAIGIDAEFRFAYQTVQNSGDIIVTSDDLANNPTIGIAIESLEVSGADYAQTIVNSGLIDAVIAINVYYESSHHGTAQTLLNSGEITGFVLLNEGDDYVLNTGTMHTRLLLEEGNDTYDGRDGVHTGSVEGGDGDDLIIGGAGDERLFGDQGRDVISAGAGTDFVEGGAGPDLLDGGGGFDLLSYLEGNQPVYADLATGFVTAGIETDIVRNFEDFVGSIKDDVILGGAVSEFLYGNAGDDLINGREGNDAIFGGAGRDVLTGGSGRDVFFYEAGDGHDEIVDLTPDDVLSIHGYTDFESIEQVGDHVRINLSATDSVLIQNYQIANLGQLEITYDSAALNIEIPVLEDVALLALSDLYIPAGATYTATNPNPESLPSVLRQGSLAVRGETEFSLDPLAFWIGGNVQLQTSQSTDWSAAIYWGRDAYVLEGGHVETSASSANHAFGIHLVDTVVNAGVITVENRNGDASGVAGTGGTNGYFVNTGQISVEAHGSARGLGIAGGTNGTHRIFNEGTIHVSGDTASYGIVQSLNAHPVRVQPVVVNSGQISVSDNTSAIDSAALSLTVGSQVSVWNSGSITGDYAIYAPAVPHSSVSDYWMKVYNTGTLDGDILTSSYGDTIINRGDIIGDVDLAGGDDLFDGRGGNLVGSVLGDDGNDTILTGAGSQALEGGFGDDILSGGAGADILTGDVGSDSFRFGIGEGADEITDFGFNGDADFIDVAGYTEYQSITQQGDDVLITFSATDTLLVRGVQVSDLTSGAIRFGAIQFDAAAIPDAPVAPEIPTPPEDLTLIPTGYFPSLVGSEGVDQLLGGIGPDELHGMGGGDILFGGAYNDLLDGGGGIDTAVVTGARSDYTIEQSAPGVFLVSGPDGTDTLTNIEYLQFDDQSVRLMPGTGVAIDFATADPDSFMAAIRDFDGNNLGSAESWEFIGSTDVNGDGDIDQIFVNSEIGRFAEVATADDGLVYFDDHGWAGETRVVGIYIDPLVASGEVIAGSDFDSQRRFQNDLEIGNIAGVLGAGDYDGDGLQEVYFSLTDGTAYLHAYMHADGNIQYANYQNEQQVIDFLESNGFGEETYGDWFS